MRSYRYRRWDGTQEPIGDDLTVESLIDELSEDILSGMDPQQAMRSLMRRGMQGNFGGINSLLERLRKAREREKAKGQLGGMLEQVREQLDRILEQERAALAERTDDPEARMREGYLDDLLPDAASQINGLKNYDFVSPEARAEFQELLEKLRQEVLGSAFRQLSSAMKNMTPEQIARMKEMLGDLNRMLDQKRNGTGPSQDEFDEFMRRYGDFFPENPRNLDELMEALAKRMAAMGRLLNSLSPEQRAELMDLAREVMDDMDLSFEVDRLASSLQDLFPDLDWDSAVPMDGDDQLGLREGLEAIERITDYDELERALRSDRAGPALQDVDVDKIRRTLGEDAVRDVRRLREIEKMLEQAGFLVRQSGRLKLTPRGVRKLGERALARVFERLDGRPAGHARRTRRRWDGRADRRDAAVELRRPVRDRRAAHGAQCGTPPGPDPRAGTPAGRRLRGSGVREPHHRGDRAAARHELLDADARQLGAGEADGAGAALADRVEVSRGSALHHRLQRARAGARRRGSRTGRLGARVRHQHGARVQSGGTPPGEAPDGDEAGAAGDRR